ncbi:hypothetical protein HK102_010521 [Quaeritorhiza haematococci]|nr:hypothetical protein HK102_010521 [Quaeritorhiza haematococci]
MVGRNNGRSELLRLTVGTGDAVGDSVEDAEQQEEAGETRRGDLEEEEGAADLVGGEGQGAEDQEQDPERDAAAAAVVVVAEEAPAAAVVADFVAVGRELEGEGHQAGEGDEGRSW